MTTRISRLGTALLLLVVLLVTGSRVFAETVDPAAATATQGFEVIGQIGGLGTSIVTEGNTLYFANGPKVLIYDISNPLSPILVGRTPFVGATIQRIDVAGNLLAAGTHEGVVMIDVANHAAPQLLETYRKEWPADTTAIALAGNRVYLGDWERAMILDITTPTNPQLLGYMTCGFYSCSRIYDIEVRGNIVYALHGGLTIFNAANPAAPTIIGSIFDSFYSLALQGNYAYVSAAGALKIIDISNTSAPLIVGELSGMGGYASGVEVSGSYAYQAASSGLIRVVNVSNPASPSAIGITPGYQGHSVAYAHIAQRDSAVYYSDGYSFRVFNFTNPVQPSQVISFPIPPSVMSMGIKNHEYAYLATEDYDGIRVVDIRNPAAPIQVAHHLSSWYYDLAVDGNYLHAVGDEWVHYRVFDISNPLVLAHVPNPETGSAGSVYDVLLEGDYAYITANSYPYFAFISLDRRDPKDIDWIWSATLNEPEWIKKNGNVAYVSNSANLFIIQIHDPIPPENQFGHLVATLPQLELNARYEDIAFAGRYAYIATGLTSAESVLIYDMADPTKPKNVGTYNPPGGASGVLVEGNQALFFNDDGVFIADISNPTAPQPIGLFPMPHPGTPERIGDRFYMAAGEGGFFILKFTPPEGPPPTYTISGKVTDSCNTPIAGVEITLDDQTITHTDANGTYSFADVPAGTHTVEPFTVGLTFIPAKRVINLTANWPTADFNGGYLSSELNNVVTDFGDRSNLRLDNTLNFAGGIAADGDFFRNRYESDVARAIAHAVFNTMSILSGGVSTVAQYEDMVKTAFPGVGAMDWGHLIRLRDANEAAARATSDILFHQPIQPAVQQLSKTILGGAMVYYLADFGDYTLEELAEAGTTQSLAELLDMGSPLQEGFHPALERLLDVYQADIAATTTATQAELPLMALEQADIDAYVEDLTKRALANISLNQSVERTEVILSTARSARETADDQWIREFLGRFIGRSLALAARGPTAALAFDFIDAAVTLYVDIKTIEADARFLATAVEGMNGALATANRIHSNSVHGLVAIATCVPPQIPAAHITSMEHRSSGEYVFFNKWHWVERTTITVLNIKNDTGYDTAFHGTALYDVTGFMGLSTRPYFIQSVKSIPGNGSSALILTYRKGGDGASPPLGAEVEFDLLGSTDTGTYHILNDGVDAWDPVRYPTSRVRSSSDNEDATVVSFPLRNDIGALPVDMGYRGVIEVNNPFGTPVDISVTQALPTGAAVVDAGGGTVQSGKIAWNRSLQADETITLVFTVTPAGTPGQVVTFPAPTLKMADTAGDDQATFTGEVLLVKLASPLNAAGRAPGRVAPGPPIVADFNITNRDDVAATGTLWLRLYDSQTGEAKGQASKGVTVAAGGTVEAEVSLPTSGLPDGDYLLVGELSAGSATVEVFARYVTIAPFKVQLPVAIRP